MFEEGTKYGRHINVVHFVLVFFLLLLFFFFSVPAAEFEPYNQIE